MNPLSLDKLPAKAIKAVFSDLDGTITTGQKITPETFQALAKLHAAGFWLVVVSGRPAGWADCLLRLWPIDAMIFENGAGILVREGDKLTPLAVAEPKPGKPSERLFSVFESLKKEIPHLKLASDQAFRKFDIAIDYAEEPPFLTAQEVEKVMKRLGAEADITVKLSSIHINYWLGKHTKITAIEKLLATEGAGRQIVESQVVFCGDSPNDEPMFSRFQNTVGVANIKAFLSKMESSPHYLTNSPQGKGFEELVACLLAQAR